MNYGAYPPPPHHPQPRRGISPWLWVLLGAVILGLGTCGGLVVCGALAASKDGGEDTTGVLLGGEVPERFRTKLAERGLLLPSEQLIAYYDGSITEDMSEVTLVTSERLVYAKGKRTTPFQLDTIATIDHRVENIIGDVIEVASKRGERLRIEIAHLNKGVSLLNALEDEVRKKNPDVKVHRATPR